MFRQVHVLCTVIQRLYLSMKSLLTALATVSSGTFTKKEAYAMGFSRHPDPKVHFGWIQALLKYMKKPN